MDSILSFGANLCGTQIVKFDGIIAVAIAVFVEYVVKFFFKKSSEKTWAIVTRISPIVLSLATYVVIAVITKNPIADAILKGIGIGLLTSGAYASLVDLAKKFFKGAFDELDKEAQDILDSEKDGKKEVEEKK